MDYVGLTAVTMMLFYLAAPRVGPALALVGCTIFIAVFSLGLAMLEVNS